MTEEELQERLARMRSHNWQVKGGYFIGEGNYRIAISCTHKKVGACGGCYARLTSAIELIKEVPEAAALICSELHQAQLAEGAAKRLKGEF